MSSKFNVLPAIRDHFETFEDHNNRNRFLLRDYAGMVGVPAAAAGLITLCQVHIRSVGTFLSGVAVLTGLLFALVIFVFQLRLQVASDPRHHNGGKLTTLIDELFANVNYAVIVGLATSVLGVIAASVEDPAAGAPVWASALLTLLGTHLVLTVLMCVKRTRSAYRRLSR